MQHKVTVQKKIIIGLCLVAVALVVVICHKHYKAKQSTTVDNFTEYQNAESKSPEEIKQAVLNAPTVDANREEISAHFQLASSIAVKTNEITITDCQSDPVVAVMKLSDSYTVKNAGQEAISFGFDAPVQIQPGASKNFKADFKLGIGIYGYDCKGPMPNQPIGFIIATK